MDTMERLLAEGDYYDYGRVLSYHAPWMFVIGARGLGKTYGAKNLSLVTGLKTLAIHLSKTYRRGTENKGTWFADIAEQYPELEFRVSGNQAECHWLDDRDATTDKHGKTRPTWHIMGYFIALSQAGQVKSVAYPKVRTIVLMRFSPIICGIWAVR